MPVKCITAELNIITAAQPTQEFWIDKGVVDAIYWYYIDIWGGKQSIYVQKLVIEMEVVDLFVSADFFFTIA